ncbi:MAG TPA: lytic transglycosylase domain-containing protein [Caulobacteraceae bacterium]|nr:lytic transglycosylase domain-containing protein [Caulobacteraceae bacterium]
MATRLASSVLASAVIAAATLAAAQGLSSDAASPASTIYQPQLDVGAATAALTAAKLGDRRRVRTLLETASTPLARKIALWAMADATPEAMSWSEADEARRDLADWPRPARRELAAERLLDRSGLAPRDVVAWFGGQEPLTAEGAMALATARRAAGDVSGATAVIRKAWRTLPCDVTVQETILARFSDLLSVDDHIAREDFLLYGSQGPAAQDLLRLLPAQAAAVAQARMALRRGDRDAELLVGALPASDQTSPGVAYERILSMRERGDTFGALSLIAYLPESLPSEAAAERIWKHGSLVVQSLQAGDVPHAYAAAARSGLSSGLPAIEAQFFAGWIALTRMKDPQRADGHFARLESLSISPITQSRALYWRGRCAQAEGDEVGAQLFYNQAARYYTTFYGQLSAARTDQPRIVLAHDPVISPADRAAFEARDAVKAARLLAAMGDHDGFRTFVGALSETLPDAASEAQLIDLVNATPSTGDLALRVVRNAAKRGIVLPERGYPIRTPNLVAGSAETPLVLGVTRQESSFDPSAHSGAGARGMMQLMPATAQTVARRGGLGWGNLDDPEYNMKVGSLFLGQLVEEFGGSYVMAAAAYNAGPGRPNQWASLCGDPRSAGTDPLDFIECIPFSETRDYVERVMEATQVYRARLNGGSAPITLAADLKRGGYGHQLQPVTTATVGAPLPPPLPVAATTMATAGSIGR